MENLKGKRVSITFDKELLELEEQYHKLPNCNPSRAELVRELYFEYLNEQLEEKENEKSE